MLTVTRTSGIVLFGFFVTIFFCVDAFAGTDIEKILFGIEADASVPPFIWVTTGKATLYRGCNFEPSGRVEPLRLGEPSHRFELRGIEKSEYILPGRIVYFFCAVDFKSYKKRDICEHSGLIPVTLELSHRDHYYIQMSKLVPAYRVIAKKGVEPLLTYYLETLEKYKNSIKLYNNSNLSGFSRPLGCILQGYSAEQWFSRKALIQMNVPEDKIDALYKEYMGAK